VIKEGFPKGVSLEKDLKDNWTEGVGRAQVLWGGSALRSMSPNRDPLLW
jgi:hypothetical protein